MENNNGGNNQQSSAGQNSSSPITTENKDPTRSTTPTNNNQAHRRQREPRALIVWTAILAIGTVALGCAAIWSDILISGQLTEMRKAGEDTKRVIEATDRLADAARNQVSTAIDTETRQLRAYVFVADADITGVDSVTGPRTVIVIKNSGLTPAYHVTHQNAYFLGAYPLKEPLPAADFSSDEKPSLFELGPGGASRKVKQRKPLSPAAISGLKDGTFAIYFYGKLRFTDAFNCHRWVRYKRMLGGPVADKGPNLVITDDGNETSDETAEDCLFKPPR